MDKKEDDTDKKGQDKSSETYKLAGEVYTQEEVDKMLGDCSEGDTPPPLPTRASFSPGQNVSRTDGQLALSPVRANDPKRQALYGWRSIKVISHY